MALNCFRYLGFKNLDEVDQLCIPEYNLLMKGVELREFDKAYYIHLQAFKNFQVTATKKSGRPVYTDFNKFFNSKKLIKEILGKNKKENNRLSRLRQFFNKKKEG